MLRVMNSRNSWLPVAEVFAEVIRIGNAAAEWCCVVRVPGKPADQVAVRCADVHFDTALVAERNDLLVGRRGLPVSGS